LIVLEGVENDGNEVSGRKWQIDEEFFASEDPKTTTTWTSN